MKYFLDTEFIEGPQDKRFLGFKIGETKPTIDLISIGIVCEDGRQLYEVSREFNVREAWFRYQIKEIGTPYNSYGEKSTRKNYWLRENVLYRIFWDLYSMESPKEAKEHYGTGKNGYNNFVHHKRSKDNCFNEFERLVLRYGKSSKYISKKIVNFINFETKNEGGQLVSGTFLPNVKPNPEFYANYCSYDWVVFCWIFGKMIELPSGFPMFCNDLQQLLNERVEVLKNNLNSQSQSKENELFDSKKVRYMIKNSPNHPVQDSYDKHHALMDAMYDKEIYNFYKRQGGLYNLREKLS